MGRCSPKNASTLRAEEMDGSAVHVLGVQAWRHEFNPQPPLKAQQSSVCIILALGRPRQVHLWLSLASQPSLSEIPRSQWETVSQTKLTTDLHTHIHTCIYINTHTHTRTQGETKAEERGFLHYQKQKSKNRKTIIFFYFISSAKHLSSHVLLPLYTYYLEQLIL